MVLQCAQLFCRSSHQTFKSFVGSCVCAAPTANKLHALCPTSRPHLLHDHILQCTVLPVRCIPYFFEVLLSPLPLVKTMRACQTQHSKCCNLVSMRNLTHANTVCHRCFTCHCCTPCRPARVRPGRSGLAPAGAAAAAGAAALLESRAACRYRGARGVADARRSEGARCGAGFSWSTFTTEVVYSYSPCLDCK